MRARGDVRPDKVLVESVGECTKAHFYYNIEEIELPSEGEEGPGAVMWEYDHIEVEVEWHEGLEDDILRDYDVWLSWAINNKPLTNVSVEDRIESVELAINAILGL